MSQLLQLRACNSYWRLVLTKDHVAQLTLLGGYQREVNTTHPGCEGGSHTTFSLPTSAGMGYQALQRTCLRRPLSRRCLASLRSSRTCSSTS